MLLWYLCAVLYLLCSQWYQLDTQYQYFTRMKLQQSGLVWLTRVIHKIQRIPMTMWQVRNHVLHTTTDNHSDQEQNKELDKAVDVIFLRKPHPRLMAHCDQAFFKKHRCDRIKQMTIRRKINWITGANLILTKYERGQTEQSDRFTSYFQWDRGWLGFKDSLIWRICFLPVIVYTLHNTKHKKAALANLGRSNLN
jgi:hypothetical protein